MAEREDAVPVFHIPGSHRANRGFADKAASTGFFSNDPARQLDHMLAEAAGTPMDGILRSGPSNQVVE